MEAQADMTDLQDIPNGLILKNALQILSCVNKGNPIWVAVMDICGVGSNSAIAICKSIGLDPNQKIYDYPSSHDKESFEKKGANAK